MAKSSIREIPEEIFFYLEKILESMGYPPAASRVYVYLIVAGKPLTINELAQLTGLGKSTVATSLKLLEHDGLVYSYKTGRAKTYRARSALNKVLFFPTKILKEYIEPLEKLLREYAGDNPQLNELLKEIEEFNKITYEIIRVIEKYREKTGEPLGEP